MIVKLTRAAHPDRWNATPLTWWPGTSDGKATAIVACGNGHAMSIAGHTINQAGLVTPSLVCPVEGCGWHVWGKLEGWTG